VLKAKGQGNVLVAACKQCHGTHNVVAVKSTDAKQRGAHLIEICGACHTKVKDTFVASEHGKALAGAITGAPDCITCHRNPISKISAGIDTAQFKLAQEKVCLSCHLDDPNVRARTSQTAGFIASYDASVHGFAIAHGNGKAANCVDCHGSHEMNKGTNPSSRVNKQNITQTCGKCHAAIAAAFQSSIHGVALQKGVTEAPTCTNCHGEHNILKHTDPKSPVAAGNVSLQVCSPCHSSVKLSQKYGFTSDRYQSFADSYHGLAGSMVRWKLQIARVVMVFTILNRRPIQLRVSVKTIWRRHVESVILEQMKILQKDLYILSQKQDKTIFSIL